MYLCKLGHMAQYLHMAATVSMSSLIAIVVNLIANCGIYLYFAAHLNTHMIITLYTRLLALCCIYRQLQYQTVTIYITHK